MFVASHVAFSATQTGRIAPLGIGQEVHFGINGPGGGGIEPLFAAEDRLPLRMILQEFFGDEGIGLVGALVIIILFALLMWRGFTIAMRAPDKFGSLLTVGLTFQVGLQAMLNIFVVTNTMPNTGISLPFFSYGGSSLVILLAEMGIILSVSRAASLQK